MPLVHAYVTPYFNQRFVISSKDRTPLQLLRYACEEIVPAGLNASGDGHLTPGSIEFIPQIVEDGLGVHALIVIEAYDYPERAANIEERAEAMKIAFNTIFPDVEFAVFPKLVKAGWSSDVTDPEFGGDMSIEAAIERYRKATRHGVLVGLDS